MSCIWDKTGLAGTKHSRLYLCNRSRPMGMIRIFICHLYADPSLATTTVDPEVAPGELTAFVVLKMG